MKLYKTAHFGLCCDVIALYVQQVALFNCEKDFLRGYFATLFATELEHVFVY